MNLENKNLTIIFLATILAALSLPVVLPGWRLMVFAPFLVVIFYKKSFLVCLWWSLACGLFVDLLTSNDQFGLHAVNYCLTSAILFTQRRNFFADSLTTLPLMTFFFACLSTIVQCLLIYTFERDNIFSWEFFLTDMVYMPACDALYAFIFYILPFLFFGKQPRRGKDYFLDKP